MTSSPKPKKENIKGRRQEARDSSEDDEGFGQPTRREHTTYELWIIHDR